MKALVCKVCGHIVLDGNTPEECPVCQSPQKAFEENRRDVGGQPWRPGNLQDTASREL